MEFIEIKVQLFLKAFQFLLVKFEPVKLKDIAKALNLSTATVSRALRGCYQISEKTKDLVVEYATKMNYRPNPIALGLKEKRTNAIGVLVPEIANNFFSQAINGIESYAHQKGYQIIITQSHESHGREQLNARYLASRGIDGLLVSLSSESANIDYLKELHGKGLPLVFFDRISDQINTHKVIADNYSGSFNGTEHLLSQGYKRIALIAGPPHLSITKERLEGYKNALAEYGISFDEQLVKYCQHAGMIIEEVHAALNDVLFACTKADAIFTTAYRLTTVCLGLLKSRLSVEIGFLGFTNTLLGDLFSSALTVIRQPAFEIGQHAIELLIGIVESRKPVTDFKTISLDTKLIIRESSLSKCVIQSCKKTEKRNSLLHKKKIVL